MSAQYGPPAPDRNPGSVPARARRPRPAPAPIWFSDNGTPTREEDPVTADDPLAQWREAAEATYGSPQLTRSEMLKLPPADLIAAFESGSLQAVSAHNDGPRPTSPAEDTAGPDDDQPDGDDQHDKDRQLTRDDLANLTPAQIAQAHNDGRLDAMLDRTTTNTSTTTKDADR